MHDRKIILTPQEVEEIKDTAGFRAKVVLELKLLRGIPNKVIRLGIQVGCQWGILLLVLGAIITKAMRVW